MSGGSSGAKAESCSPVQSSSCAMNGEVLCRKVTITNPMGFHLRPMAAFARLASQFQSTVTVCKDQVRANGKSAMELMLLAAEQGTELVVEVSGNDAPAALEALAKLLAASSVDDASQPPLPPKG